MPIFAPRRSGLPASRARPAHVHITRALVTTLGAVTEQITMLYAQIAEQLASHTDAHTFTSLPRSGTVRAAQLLAEIGDCRARFPTPESLRALPVFPRRLGSPERCAP